MPLHQQCQDPKQQRTVRLIRSILKIPCFQATDFGTVALDARDISIIININDEVPPGLSDHCDGEACGKECIDKGADNGKCDNDELGEGECICLYDPIHLTVQKSLAKGGSFAPTTDERDETCDHESCAKECIVDGANNGRCDDDDSCHCLYDVQNQTD